GTHAAFHHDFDLATVDVQGDGREAEFHRTALLGDALDRINRIFEGRIVVFRGQDQVRALGAARVLADDRAVDRADAVLVDRGDTRDIAVGDVVGTGAPPRPVGAVDAGVSADRRVDRQHGLQAGDLPTAEAGPVRVQALIDHL